MQQGLPFEPEYPPHLFVRHPRARRYVVSVGMFDVHRGGVADLEREQQQTTGSEHSM